MKLKAIIITTLLALIMAVTDMSAQIMNIHKTDGTKLNIPLTEISKFELLSASILLPAAGLHRDKELSHKDSFGIYWSPTIGRCYQGNDRYFCLTLSWCQCRSINYFFEGTKLSQVWSS